VTRLGRVETDSAGQRDFGGVLKQAKTRQA
jgi:hypothetical protein